MMASRTKDEENTEAERGLAGWLAGWTCVVPVQQLPVPSVPSVLVLIEWAFIKVSD